MKFWRTIKNHLLPWRGNAHRPHILRRQWLVAFLGLALLSEAAIVGSTLLTGAPNIFLAAVVRSDVIAYTDEARAGEGGSTLRESEVLDAAAQAKADDMAAKGYFAHVDPAGEQPWAWFKRGGYSYVYAGENLAVKFNDSKDVVDAWMASPTHHANIVKPQYQEIGVGIAQGMYQGQQATFVVQFFASPSIAQSEGRASPTLAQAATPVATSPKPAQAPVTPTKTTPTPAAASPVAASAPAEVAPATVAGAEVQPAPASLEAPAPTPAATFSQTVLRMIARAFGDSRSAATWTLGIIAAILAVVLALTFFIRIQVQPTDLLLPGLAVALVAVVLLGANAKLLPASPAQSASVAQSAQGDIGEGAATQQVNVAFPEAPAAR